MNWPFFISGKLIAKREKSMSSVIVRMAILSVALSSSVMILSVATVTGFQSGITAKILGLNGHLVIDDISNTEGSEPAILEYAKEELTGNIRSVKGVKSVSLVAVRPGIAKGDEEIDGMLIKGVSPDYDFSFFRENLVEGTVPDFRSDSNQVLISSSTAQRLGLKTGQYFQVIFFRQDSAGNPKPRAINPKICGIFNTGLEEVDKTLAITHISLARKAMPKGFTFTQWEILTKDYSNAQAIADELLLKLPAGQFNVNTAQRYNRQIFDWLRLLDTNVIIIISLMLLVAVIGISTTLLILITERTQMIGTLKALGARNSRIRRIFIYQSLFITFMGLMAGNIIAITIGLLQQKTGFISLNTEIYYVNRVLVEFTWWHVAAINLLTILIIFLVMNLPARMVSRLQPIRVMRFQ